MTSQKYTRSTESTTTCFPRTPPKRNVQQQLQNLKLKSEVNILHNLMKRRQSEHQFEINELREENRELAYRIQVLECSLGELEEKQEGYINNQMMLNQIRIELSARQIQILKGEKREMELVRQNEKFERIIEEFEKDLQKLTEEKLRAFRLLGSYQKGNIEEKERIDKIIKSLQRKMEEATERRSRVEEEVAALREKFWKVQKENGDMKKDMDCLFQLISND